MKVLSVRKSLRSDPAGTATMELALVFPVLAMMALAGVDFVMGFTHKLELQQYAQAGADFVSASDEDTPTTAQVKTEIVAVSGLDASAVAVEVWTECNSAKHSGTLTDCPGSSDVKAQYMKITVTDEYDPILDIEGVADFVKKKSLTGKATVRLPKD